MNRFKMAGDATVYWIPRCIGQRTMNEQWTKVGHVLVLGIPCFFWLPFLPWSVDKGKAWESLYSPRSKQKQGLGREHQRKSRSNSNKDNNSNSKDIHSAPYFITTFPLTPSAGGAARNHLNQPAWYLVYLGINRAKPVGYAHRSCNSGKVIQ